MPKNRLKDYRFILSDDRYGRDSGYFTRHKASILAHDEYAILYHLLDYVTLIDGHPPNFMPDHKALANVAFDTQVWRNKPLLKYVLIGDTPDAKFLMRILTAVRFDQLYIYTPALYKSQEYLSRLQQKTPDHRYWSCPLRAAKVLQERLLKQGADMFLADIKSLRDQSGVGLASICQDFICQVAGLTPGQVSLKLQGI